MNIAWWHRFSARIGGERGEGRAVGPVQAWPRMGAAQHGNLVPQHEQLEILGHR
jgi:hypothetical protein